MKPLNSKAILKNLELVLKTNNIEKLNGPTYNFLYLMSGFIAHYNINGFKCEYRDLRKLVNDLDSSMDTRDWTRYVSDSYFSTGENAPYYFSKASVLQEIPALVEKYRLAIDSYFADSEKEKDLALASALLRKHGLKVAQ